jgi:hypothetical protein
VRSGGVDGPDACCVVGRTGSQMTDVGGEKDAGDVGSVCDELADGED